MDWITELFEDWDKDVLSKEGSDEQKLPQPILNDETET
jgi:hypothetical protein